MARYLVSLILLVAVVSSVVPEDLLDDPASPVHLVRTEQPMSGSGFPDTSCPGTCLCPLCPGRILAPRVSLSLPAFALPAHPFRLPGYASDLHSQEVLDRIFHPPRLG